jgi:WD40 repeat protein
MPAARSPELFVQTGHAGSVHSVAWSPDGKTLASGSPDHTIKLWDASNGQLLRTLSGHFDTVESVAWSPDGKTLASGSADHMIKLWDASNGQALRTITGRAVYVMSVAWSVDGKTLASGSSDNTIKLWDVSNGQLLRTISGHAASVFSVSWSVDGKTLASGSADHTIKLWDASSGQPLRTLRGHSRPVDSVAWSADGKTLASGSQDNTIKLWDTSNGQLQRTLIDHALDVTSVAWRPDGKTLASGSGDHSIKLWDTTNGQLLRTLDGHSEAVYSVAWSADGKTLASGSADHTIILWDARNGIPLRTMPGYSGEPLPVAWPADGETLASGSTDHTIKLWDATGGQLLRALIGHADTVTSVAWSPDGKTLASGSSDKTINFWDATNGQLLRTFSGHAHTVTSVALNADGKTLASGSLDQSINLWDATSGRLLRTLIGQPAPVRSLTWSPDGKTLASGSGITIELWRLSDGHLLRTLSGHSDSVKSLAWSPDGKTLASGSGITIELWRLSDGHLLRTLSGHSDSVKSLAWSPDGKTLASGSNDGTIKVWNPDQETPVDEFALGAPVSSIDWNGSAQSIAAATDTAIHVIEKLRSPPRLSINQFPGGEWLAQRPGQLYYASSLQGDEHASIRFDHRLRGLYPLSLYRNRLRVAKLSETDSDPPIGPIFGYDLRRNVNEYRLWLAGTGFLWFAAVAFVFVRSGRADPEALGKSFFLKAGNPGAEFVLWPARAGVSGRGARGRVYVLFSDPVPRPDELQKLREERNVEAIPVSLARVERAVAEDNCARTLAEIEEPFTIRQDPYDEGVPVRDETWFYGRRDLLERLPAILRQGQHAGIFGIRKVGKTSLLNQLRDRLLRNTAVVLIDCQGHEANADEYFGAILEGFRNELKTRAGLALPAGSGSFREQFLALRTAWLETGSREIFVLILDEADKLFPDRRLAESTKTLGEGVRLFRMLRALAQEQQAVSLLLCGYRADLNRQNLLGEGMENPLHMSVQENYLQFLTADESRAMVREIGGWKQIEWTDAALERTYEWCAGHPLVTRFFASDACERGSRKQVDEGRVAEVAAAIERDFRKHRIGVYFRESIWGILYPDEQECLRRVAAGEAAGEELSEARTNLEQFGLIGEGDAIQGGLLRRWLERQ